MNVKYATVLGAVLALMYTTGCTSDKKPAGQKAAAKPLQVSGTVALVGQHVDFGRPTSGNECVGKGDFSDVKGGAQVRITDETGKTLAVTRLGMGIADTSTSDLASGSCDFTFGASVPSGHSSYTIQVINHGNQTFTEKQMAAPQLSLG
jgi:hypothetical protein